MNKSMSEEEQMIINMMMSETLHKLCFLARGLNVDVGKTSDLKEAFGACSFILIDALDKGLIHFDNEEDEIAFNGLLTVVVDYVMNGNLKNSFKKASIN